MSRSDPQFNLRLPKDLLEDLRQVAQANGRSVTEEVKQMLERFVADSERTVKTQLRLPAPIHVAFIGTAKASRRSMNAEIVGRLARSLAQDGQP